MRAPGWALLCLCNLACQHAPKALPPPPPPARAELAHPGVLAVLPVIDARPKGDGADLRGRYIYRGVEYRGTRLEALGRDPGLVLARRWAARLAAERVFSKVIVGPSEGADYVLKLWLIRLRGYVEAAPEEGAQPRALGEATWRAELRDGNGALLSDLELGWAVFERRPGVNDPWEIFAEGLVESYAQLAAELRGARLQPLPARVALPAVQGRLQPPPGWSLSRSGGAAVPGWSGPADCEALRFVMEDSPRYNRRRGLHQPTVRLWRCPRGAPRRLDDRADHFARLLGADPSAWVFGLRVGRSNWPGALSQLSAALRLRPPAKKYVAQVDAESEGPLRGLRPAPAPGDKTGRTGPARIPLELRVQPSARAGTRLHRRRGGRPSRGLLCGRTLRAAPQRGHRHAKRRARPRHRL